MARTVLAARPNCRPTRRSAALSQASPTASSKRLLKGALLGISGTFSCLDAAVGTAHPIELDHHRRAILRPRQIPYLALVDLSNFLGLPTTAGTLQFSVPTLTSHPQTQRLVRFVDLAA